MGFTDWKSTHSSKQSGTSEITRVHFLDESKTLPRVYSASQVDLSLMRWYCSNEAEINDTLMQFGAVLFRGFKMHDQDDFSEFVARVFSRPAAYVEGATPRTNLGTGVYTSTEFSNRHEIAFHNELSYVTEPPGRLAFCCIQPPETGGQTPIAHVGKVYERISPATKDLFDKHGWLLRRHYCKGFGPTIFKAFDKNTISGVREYCEQANVQLFDLGGDHYLTEQTRPAVHYHPKDDQPLWFNHVAFWHVSSLSPEIRGELQNVFGESAFPYSTFLGDGSDIPHSIIDEIRQAYQAEEVLFDWHAGDVLLLDNWRVAHGRKPFTGKRKVLVAMS